ncbi:ATP-dependent RNA helicase SUPV3L1/SUV3 [Sporobacter termitidis DSM 10068]|uniref:RNA helicase n=1 Tax=Sporobacter termitidis DSM 10068 TaxID=1123282 RepID=A0A1M5YDR6_9FIRM|nr:helicase-related protein [Sporobacter termitidis]SHI10034.1 ATP-dependent RNA helicase SUPV3L1/SUV3 [Sporobacter termitidis DSM 10068]
MKKAQKAMREFDKISAQLDQTAHIVHNTKDGKLWDHEAIVRKRIKALKELEFREFKGFDDVYRGYLELLDEISVRILRHYNKKKGTDYDFDEIVKTDRAGYLSSGIISVLVTSHIPKLVAQEFNRHFPANPKDEYDAARKMKRGFILHLGETNTGKTYRAIQRLKESQNGVYLAPLRILALENYERLNREGVPTSLLTGEEELAVEGARHVCSTIEKLDIEKEYDVAVIDEVQMIGNSQRGFAWTRALLGLRCREIHVCGALNAKRLLVRLLEDCGDEYQIIEYKRDTPLEVSDTPFELREIQQGDALVAFSKKRVLELSKYFQDRGVKNSVIYGDLPPEVRRMQYHAFVKGGNRILITTDAIGMGVNLPIRRIIFMDLQKFDGEEKRYITSQEVKQIAGRAGRKGIYDVGYVCTTSIDHLFLRENLETEDEPLQEAVLGPSEAIMDIKGLPLREKLALWSTNQERLDYYRKMDVRDYLLVLDSIRQYRLPEAAEYKLMKLPFDVGDTELLGVFLDYVDEFFVKKQREITRPKPSGHLLYELEKYYQKLGLYYSFAKNFDARFDPEWVYGERVKTSERINKLLVRL